MSTERTLKQVILSHIELLIIASCIFVLFFMFYSISTLFLFRLVPYLDQSLYFSYYPFFKTPMQDTILFKRKNYKPLFSLFSKTHI